MKTLKLSNKQVKAFQAIVYENYHRLNRVFPWRKTTNPYRILVSEIMLQQTQVSRVNDTYRAFLKRFPTIRILARSSLAEVLSAWQGLGYNRRAVSLHKIAQEVVSHHNGRVPSTLEALVALPGIGHATACCILAFAFNQSVVFIETNIRSVFIHHFFQHKKGVVDTDILPLVAVTADRQNPRVWFWALMDYGVALKSTFPNPSRRSAHHQRQTPFEGSHRQVRGMVLKALLAGGTMTLTQLSLSLARGPERVFKALEQLTSEGVVQKRGRFWVISAGSLER